MYGNINDGKCRIIISLTTRRVALVSELNFRRKTIKLNIDFCIWYTLRPTSDSAFEKPQSLKKSKAICFHNTRWQIAWIPICSIRKTSLLLKKTLRQDHISWYKMIASNNRILGLLFVIFLSRYYIHFVGGDPYFRFRSLANGFRYPVSLHF